MLQQRLRTVRQARTMTGNDRERCMGARRMSCLAALLAGCATPAEPPAVPAGTFPAPLSVTEQAAVCALSEDFRRLLSDELPIADVEVHAVDDIHRAKGLAHSSQRHSCHSRFLISRRLR